jgi:hypothetical protein
MWFMAAEPAQEIDCTPRMQREAVRVPKSLGIMMQNRRTIIRWLLSFEYRSAVLFLGVETSCFETSWPRQETTVLEITKRKNKNQVRPKDPFLNQLFETVTFSKRLSSRPIIAQSAPLHHVLYPNIGFPNLQIEAVNAQPMSTECSNNSCSASILLLDQNGA